MNKVIEHIKGRFKDFPIYKKALEWDDECPINRQYEISMGINTDSELCSITVEDDKTVIYEYINSYDMNKNMRVDLCYHEEFRIPKDIQSFKNFVFGSKFLKEAFRSDDTNGYQIQLPEDLYIEFINGQIVSLELDCGVLFLFRVYDNKMVTIKNSTTGSFNPEDKDINYWRLILGAYIMKNWEHFKNTLIKYNDLFIKNLRK